MPSWRRRRSTGSTRRCASRRRRARSRRYERDIAYSTDEHLELLCTYSGHLALEARLRRGLLDCIRELIDGRFGGRVVKRSLTELAVEFLPSGAGAGAAWAAGTAGGLDRPDEPQRPAVKR
jgi:hypothetical protein